MSVGTKADLMETEDLLTEVRMTSPSGGQKGVKLDAYGLIPPKALRYVALVFGYGASKYSPHNWRKGYPWSWSYSALLRHVEAARGGEFRDPESKLPHLAHAIFHCLTLITFKEQSLGEDDVTGNP